MIDQTIPAFPDGDEHYSARVLDEQLVVSGWSWGDRGRGIVMTPDQMRKLADTLYEAANEKDGAAAPVEMLSAALSPPQPLVVNIFVNGEKVEAS